MFHSLAIRTSCIDNLYGKEYLLEASVKEGRNVGSKTNFRQHIIYFILTIILSYGKPIFLKLYKRYFFYYLLNHLQYVRIMPRSESRKRDARVNTPNEILLSKNGILQKRVIAVVTGPYTLNYSYIVRSILNQTKNRFEINVAYYIKFTSYINEETLLQVAPLNFVDSASADWLWMF